MDRPQGNDTSQPPELLPDLPAALSAALPLHRSASGWPTGRCSGKAPTTPAAWATTPSPGACTGPALASPSGTTARKSCWAHPRPGGSESTWTSTQGFCLFTESATARLISSTGTGARSLVRCTRGSGSGQRSGRR